MAIFDFTVLSSISLLSISLASFFICLLAKCNKKQDRKKNPFVPPLFVVLAIALLLPMTNHWWQGLLYFAFGIIAISCLSVSVKDLRVESPKVRTATVIFTYLFCTLALFTALTATIIYDYIPSIRFIWDSLMN